MKNKHQWLIRLMTVTGLMMSAQVHAQEWGAAQDQPEVEMQQQDPWGAEPAEPEVQAEDPWGAEPAETAPPAMEPEWPEPEPEPLAPVAQDPAVEMQQIQMQLQQISMQLQQIQQQALQVQDVMDAFEAYESRLREKMLALSPEAEADIAAAEALVEELRAVTDPSQLDPEEAQEFQAKYMEFQQTAQRLQPIEQQASMDPEMQDAREELEELVMEAMRGVDPTAESIMEEHEGLVERYMELEEQRQRQQPMAPQDQPFEAPDF